MLHAYKLQRRLEGASRFPSVVRTCFSRRVTGTGVTISALHPGVVNTFLWRDLPSPLRMMAYGLGSLFFRSPVKGAGTLIRFYVNRVLQRVTVHADISGLLHGGDDDDDA